MSIDQQLVEVVDFDGAFHADFERMFGQLRLLRAGLKFNVVTVLGCQSSGKSTLLNSLFGTQFPEMNSSAGRSQTTKGIWCSRDRDSATLVIDVEGTDSKERGEDRLTFEHRASLFSLAVADAVIVNMWYHDIGRYTASNYGLLKTVLGVMLELFHTTADGTQMAIPDADDEKTVMIFIIRDFDPALCTPLPKLERSLLADVEQIWADIKKPLSLKNTQPDDFFRFIVVGLPNKLSGLQKFVEQVQDLKTKWLTKWAPAEYSRKVPADGFPLYARSVWESIMSSQQLNIPSQKEMVALYRCDEIKNQAFAEVRLDLEKAAAATQQPQPAGACNSSAALHDVLERCLTHYHNEAWRYETTVYERKRDELLELIFDSLQKSHDQKSNDLRQQLLKTQLETLRSQLRKDPFDSSRMLDGRSVLDHWSALDGTLATWKAETLQAFEGQCDASRISQTITFEDGAKPLEVEHIFKSNLQEQLLEEQLAEILAKVHDEEIASYRKFLHPQVDELRGELEALQLSVEKIADYWPAASQSFANRVQLLWTEHQAFLPGLFAADEPITDGDTTRESSAELSKTMAIESPSAKDRLTCILYTELRNNLTLRNDRIADQVYKRFKKYFEVDDAGVPNYWATSSPDQIKKLYLTAKERALPLHKELCKYKIDLLSLVSNAETAKALLADAGLTVDNTELLPPGKELDSSALCEKYMLKSCQEAQFIQATGGQVTKAAWWMWLLILCLGWNEIMFVIRSPIFSISLITFATILVAAWYTGSLFMIVRSGRLATSFALSAILPILQNLQQDARAVTSTEN